MLHTNREACLKIGLCGSLHIELHGTRLDGILLHHYRGALLAYLGMQPGVIRKSDDIGPQHVQELGIMSVSCLH